MQLFGMAAALQLSTAFCVKIPQSSFSAFTHQVSSCSTLGFSPKISEKKRARCILGKGRLEAVAILFDSTDSLEQKATNTLIKQANIEQLYR